MTKCKGVSGLPCHEAFYWGGDNINRANPARMMRSGRGTATMATEQAHRNEALDLEGGHDVKGAPGLSRGAGGRRAHTRHLHRVRPPDVQQALPLPEHVALQLVVPQAARHIICSILKPVCALKLGPPNVQQALSLPEHLALQLVVPQAAQHTWNWAVYPGTAAYIVPQAAHTPTQWPRPI